MSERTVFIIDPLCTGKITDAQNCHITECPLEANGLARKYECVEIWRVPLGETISCKKVKEFAALAELDKAREAYEAAKAKYDGIRASLACPDSPKGDPQ